MINSAGYVRVEADRAACWLANATGALNPAARLAAFEHESRLVEIMRGADTCGSP